MERNQQDTGTPNLTQQNILHKKRILALKRRRRMLILLILFFFASILFLLFVLAGYKIYSWGAGVYGGYRAMYSDYEKRHTENLGTPITQNSLYTNILFLGLDDGAGSKGQKVKHIDTLLIASIENATGRVRFISVPRDTWIPLANTAGGARASDLYAAGGAPLTVRAIDSLLGITIQQYVVLNMETFAELIDALGGADAYVETDMDYEDKSAGLSIHLKKGYRHLTGEETTEYLRYRSPELGDVGRTQRQQQFARSLFESLFHVGTLPHLPAVWNILRNKTETSIERYDLPHLLNVALHISSGTPETVMLPGIEATDGTGIWWADRTRIKTKIDELFPPANAPPQNK